MRANPAAADYNGDGFKELVVPTDDGRLFVVGWNGGAWVVLWSRSRGWARLRLSEWHKVALVAAMHKLVCILNKRNQRWNLNSCPSTS